MKSCKSVPENSAELDVDQSGGLSKQELTDGLGLYAAKHEGAREALEQQLGAGTLSMYFGYGSNMSPEGMASKGLTPLRSYRAVLHGYQLCFNLRTVGLCDPSFANVEPCEGAEVHGVAIAFSAEDMKRLDGFEASYDRPTVRMAGPRTLPKSTSSTSRSSTRSRSSRA